MKVLKADQLAINNLRMLSAEMIERAGSGHPGLPLGAAPMMWCLWSRHLRVNSRDPQWFNRDRFVLSAGHGSALLYSMLHLAGFDLTIDDLKHFRQFGSRTPGHPEYGAVPGVEATTGPLGQGLGMAVGMAVAERFLAAEYNQAGKLVDHYTYALVGDGDLMEGVSHEVASFAGRQRLNKLIVLYDSNDVSLDGPTARSFTTNVRQRFASYGWDTHLVADGNDIAAIDQALSAAKQTATPTLIEVRTTIGYGAPAAGTNQVHGQPLGADGLAALRKNLAWSAPPFTVLPEVAQAAQKMVNIRGQQAAQKWQQQVAALAKTDPTALAKFKQLLVGRSELQVTLPRYDNGAESGRDTSHQVIQNLAQQDNNFVGGSADLATSNRTTIEDSPLMTPEDPTGRNIVFGVREFGEGTILNGMALHGGLHVFGATFLVFSDYLRPAIRLAALQKLPVTFVFTHDSLAVGEDGPTHQPVEQLMSLRQIPGVEVFRPADPNEVMAAWNQAISSIDHPTILILSRQQLEVLPNTKVTAEQGVDHGGYVISPQQGLKPAGILLATGSEVSLALQVQMRLQQLGQDVSVVSLPSMERFARQSAKYQAQVLPPQVRCRVAIELGSPQGWEKYVGLDGEVVGVESFGISGSLPELMQAAGFTVDRIVQVYQQARAANKQSLSVIG
ncbi:transketolase [Liquorilactobacillus ghanensis DSM 18630]|uniref:Transketolase n=1 Tax=Liquorilactobacillus ghanensis DSM 18630 TaxID=1423750 RepID=A0A0R1VNX6_9LACO|nr:transketolase [Liquorilactobacillus ghanensis]KRM04547.1 transketolase [Liquorilactobacillus ghanensis DSM 18630]